MQRRREKQNVNIEIWGKGKTFDPEGRGGDMSEGVKYFIDNFNDCVQVLLNYVHQP